jgi:hypothetical protein
MDILAIWEAKSLDWDFPSPSRLLLSLKKLCKALHNFLKDHKTYLLSDRMSCSSFWANQFRLFLHSAAYVLIHTLQSKLLKGTEYGHATMKNHSAQIVKSDCQGKNLKN